ncbi:MAG TPA: hypothetical protein VGA51_13025, partial [Casimicrobiaceae bacterium]
AIAVGIRDADGGKCDSEHNDRRLQVPVHRPLPCLVAALTERYGTVGRFSPANSTNAGVLFSVVARRRGVANPAICRRFARSEHALQPREQALHGKCTQDGDQKAKHQ